MPRKYTQKRSEPGAYHVFHKAAEGAWLFRDDEDRQVFQYIVGRYLTLAQSRDSRGRPYVNLRAEVRLSAMCILNSHFHLILWQRIPGGIDRLMRRVMHAYVKHYNRKYGFSDSPFAGRYRARRIDNAKSFMWRVAYVHGNHKRLGPSYEFSTHSLYLKPAAAPTWLEVDATLKVFGGLPAYKLYIKRRAVRNALDDDLRGP